MTRTQIAICDDSPNDLALTGHYLRQYLKEQNHNQAQVEQYTSAFEFLGKLELKQFDIVLLDVLVSGISGTEIAATLHRAHPLTKIIFLTHSREYAVEAFSVRAVHYLMKPLQPDSFKEALDRAFLELGVQNEPQITIKLTGGAVAKLCLGDIQYINSFLHEQILYLKQGEKLLARQSLSFFVDLVDHLAPGQFVQPCKGYLVNLNAVRIVEQEGIVLRSGEKLPIARNNFRTIRDAYCDFNFVDT